MKILTYFYVSSYTILPLGIKDCGDFQGFLGIRGIQIIPKIITLFPTLSYVVLCIIKRLQELCILLHGYAHDDISIVFKKTPVLWWHFFPIIFCNFWLLQKIVYLVTWIYEWWPLVLWWHFFPILGYTIFCNFWLLHKIVYLVTKIYEWWHFLCLKKDPRIMMTPFPMLRGFLYHEMLTRNCVSKYTDIHMMTMMTMMTLWWHSTSIQNLLFKKKSGYLSCDLCSENFLPM